MSDYEGFDARAIAHDVGLIAQLQKALAVLERAATEAKADLNEDDAAGILLNHLADARADLDAAQKDALHALGRLPDPEEKGRRARSHATLGLGGRYA